MNRMKTAQLALPSLVALALQSWGVSAQDAAQAETKAKSNQIETIMVTARKLSENLQETPVAITALTPESLERRQINGTTDLGKVTPNLEFTNNAPLAGNNSSSQVFIRGIGQVDPSAGVDPGVGLYIDDVYMGQSVGGSMDLRDIYDVQVLRGPQGTLFGRNTIGGAVLISTVKPGDEFRAKVKVGVGSDNLLTTFVGVDLPVSDTLLTRFTYGSKKQDGYVTRAYDGVDLGDTNNFVVTAKMLYQPSDALEINLNFDYAEADEHGSPLVFAASNESATFQKVASADAGCPGFEGGWNSLAAVPNIDDSRCANDFWAAGPYENNGTIPLESTLENKGLSLNIAYELSDSLMFKSITAKRKLDWHGVRDADNTPFTILHTDYTSSGSQFSQELQAIYTGDAIKAVAGAYYYTEEYTDILTVNLNTPAPGEQKDSDNVSIDNKNTAFFAQATYNINEKLAATLGIRHTSETKQSLPDQFDYANPDVKYLEAKWYSADFSKTNIAANLSYQLADNVMLYGSYSEGFKGGGFNSHFNVPQSQSDLDNFHKFDQEEATTWEAGTKMDLLDHSLRLNMAAFTTDYTGLQFLFRVGPAPYLLNAGKATISGLEMEATWKPTENWIIEGGFGLLDDSIDSIAVDFEALGASTSITTDNTLAYTPDFKGSLGAGYTIEAGNWFIVPRADLSYRDATFFDTANTPEIAQLNSVTTVDLSVSFENDDLNLKINAGINNATDEIYPTAGNSSLSSGSGYAEIAYARPRQVFINLTYEFY